MSLIDQTYFIAEISLPIGTYSELDSYISRFEPEILERAFGYELAKLIQLYNENSTAQIKAIVEGAEYEMDGKTYKWVGLKNVSKISLIAYYVYYCYRRATVTTTTNTGEMAAVNENAQRAETGMKIMDAWNRMLQQLDSCYNYMEANINDYPDFAPGKFGSVNAFDL